MYNLFWECMSIVTIELHGYNREQAENKLLDGMVNALNYGERVVRIIHGQGKHSEVFPVLKSMVRHWLEESDFARENIKSIYRGEDGSPFTSPNPGETVVVFKNFADDDPGLHSDFDEEEQREMRRNNKRMKADRLRTARRRRF